MDLTEALSNSDNRSESDIHHDFITQIDQLSKAKDLNKITINVMPIPPRGVLSVPSVDREILQGDLVGQKGEALAVTYSPPDPEHNFARTFDLRITSAGDMERATYTLSRIGTLSIAKHKLDVKTNQWQNVSLTSFPPPEIRSGSDPGLQEMYRSQREEKLAKMQEDIKAALATYEHATKKVNESAENSLTESIKPEDTASEVMPPNVVNLADYRKNK